MKNRISFLLGLSLLLIASSAHAQAPQTWVSGVGDDFNDCIRTAPCKTFAGAISRTAVSGEISVLDPGDFGTVVITKSITINGDSMRAGILAAGANGVIVNVVTPGDPGVVILRGLSINGGGTGLNGIRYLAGATVVLERCSIYGFTQNDIDVSLSASGSLVVRNTTLTGGIAGIHLTSRTGVGTLSVAVDHTAIQGATTGIDSLYGSTEVTNSVIAGNTGFGVLAEGGREDRREKGKEKGKEEGTEEGTEGATISVANSLLTNNGVAVQAQAGATVRLSNNEIFDNLTAIGCGGGTVASADNNKKAGNTGGLVPVCRPNARITQY